MSTTNRFQLRALIFSVPFFVCIVTCQVSATIFSVENRALNTLGGQRLQDEFGDRALIYTLENARDFILKAFSLDKSSGQHVDHITLVVEDVDGIAYTVGSEIRLSARYVEQLSPKNWYRWKRELVGVLYHEMTHLLQNLDGDYYHDAYFRGVVEGTADFIRLRSGYQSWKRQRGGNWYDGYSTTAFFFDWIEKTHLNSFVNRLNYKMGQTPSWTNDFFLEITKRDVDSLWQEYQRSLPQRDLHSTSL